MVSFPFLVDINGGMCYNKHMRERESHGGVWSLKEVDKSY